jgi:hypothetical protein
MTSNLASEEIAQHAVMLRKELNESKNKRGKFYQLRFI